MQTSKWTSLDLTSDSGAKKFAPLAGAGNEKSFLRIRKSDNYVELWPLLTMIKNLVIPGDLTLEVTLTNDTFGANAAVAANWTVTVGDTVLTFDSVVKNSATKCTLTFTGAEAVDGTITVLAKKAALTVADHDSGVLTVITSPSSSSSTIAQKIFVLTQVSAGAVNPTMALLLNNEEFVSSDACSNISNWTFVYGTTTLTVGSIAYVSPRRCVLSFLGTAVAGTITMSYAAAACLVGTESPSRSYTLGVAADAQTFTQTEIAGTVDVYQWLRGSNESGFVGTLTPAAKTGTFVKDLLISLSGSAFTPSLEPAFIYIPGGAEAANFKIYAKLCIE